MQSAPNDLLEGAGEWCAGVGSAGGAARCGGGDARESRTRHDARSDAAEPARLQLAPPIRQTGNDYMRDSFLALLCSAAG